MVITNAYVQVEIKVVGMFTKWIEKNLHVQETKVKKIL